MSENPSLRRYFQELIDRVESSDEIHNGGTDKNGFYKPTRTIVLKQLHLLKDLHDKPRAHAMVKGAWEVLVQEMPPEWLVVPEELRAELMRILKGSSVSP